MRGVPVHACNLDRSSEDYIFREQKKRHKMTYVVRNFILKLTLISEKNNRSRIFFRSNASIYFERKRHIQSNYLYIIHPFSMFRLFWECFMILVYIMCLVILPFNVARNMEHVATGAVLTPTHGLLLIGDLFCIMDIIIHCLTGYENMSTGEVCLVPSKIFWYYFRSGGFLLDTFSSLPYQVIRYDESISFDMKLYVIMAALFKVIRSRTLFRYFRQLSANWHLNTIVFKLVLYISISLFVLHWSACVFIIIPKLVSYKHPNISSWMQIENLTFNDTGTQYKFSIFMATAAFLCVRYTRSETKAIADTIMLTMSYVLGYLMCILIFVILLQMVLSFNTPATKYESIMNQLNQYMRHRQLPLNLQHRLVQYYSHRFRKTYFRESAIMPILSDRLQLEINLHCYTTLVENVTILHDLPDEIVSNIVSNLKSEVYLPNDIIIKAGTGGDCMYFIACGTVSVSTPTGREVCHLQDGAYFGEVALIRKDQKRIANVVAIEICEVYKLDRRIFKNCLATQPDVFKKLEKIAQDRYNRTNFLEELHKKHILERTLARKHDMGD